MNRKRRMKKDPQKIRRDKALRAVQYICAGLCVVFLVMLVKNISDDQASYYSQERSRELAAKLTQATPEVSSAQTPEPFSTERIETSTPAPTEPLPAEGEFQLASNEGGLLNFDMSPFTTLSASAEGGDLLSGFFATPEPTASPAPTPTPDPNEGLLVVEASPDSLESDPFANSNATQATPEPANDASDPFAQAAGAETNDDPFASFFGNDSAPEPTAEPVSGRLAKYQGAPPALQSKYLTGDFYYLNPDFVGFLTAGVAIAEPVPYGRDNEYYLANNFYLEEDVAGAAFMDARCRLWPRSQNVVIHGHNMKNDTIFGTLPDMRHLSNLRDFPTIAFDTLYSDATYVIYAAFDASMNEGDKDYFNVARFDFADEEEFNEFVGELVSRSIFDIPVDVNYDDELLTLVTCSYYQDNGRFMVFARALREGETAESMAQLMQGAKKSS